MGNQALAGIPRARIGIPIDEQSSADSESVSFGTQTFDFSKASAEYLSHSSDTRVARALNQSHASPTEWQARRD
jgi:hypothetical protein